MGARMANDAATFQRYICQAPLCVMTHALFHHVLPPAVLNSVFAENAKIQYDYAVPFSSITEIMASVACRTRASVNAAYVAQAESFPVSVQALYGKLQGVELDVSRQLVVRSALRCEDLLKCMPGGKLPPLLRDYSVRILDGNHLAGTEHRLEVLRPTSNAALPGKSLAVLDPESRLIVDLFPCEDGHAQERSLLPQVIETIRPRQLWIADRNFCTGGFLHAIRERLAFFVIRQHLGLSLEVTGERKYIGTSETGEVYEQSARLPDPNDETRIMKLRRITVVLKQPDRDGNTELHIVTNLPKREASALKVAELYRDRWLVETAFFNLTMNLRCELNTLGYPKAALFSFSVAVACYNILAVILASLSVVHETKVIQTTFSYYYMAREIMEVTQGMLIALPPKTWSKFRQMSAIEMAEYLRHIAGQINLSKYRKTIRGPKKPVVKLEYQNGHHDSTAKLLENKPKKLPTCTDPGHP